MSFESFLKNQVDRDDPVGDFAKDVFDDKAFEQLTNPDKKSSWLYYLHLKSACDGAMKAFEEVWKEYGKNIA
jgi:uncharacterized protein YozE (UPF0346 family)